MTNRRESFGDILVRVPFWVSLLLGASTYSVVSFGLPLLGSGTVIADSIQVGAQTLGCLATLPFLLFSLLSLHFRARCRRLAEGAVSLESLREVSWKSFEFLVGEVYRRQGYRVDFALGTGPDGGIDLEVRKDGETTLVQCKHWKSRSVGVSVVREIFGLLTARKVGRAAIVTSGTFTSEAARFAQGKPIDLLDGPALVKLIQALKVDSTTAANVKDHSRSSGKIAGPTCPRCAAPLVIRIARRGPNRGSRFLGCSAFPNCRHSEKVLELETVS